jgi:hypothetical protein
MALIGSSNEEKIWNYFKSKGLSNAGVAGLMGNLYAESGFRPNNLQNTYEKKLGLSDDEYTAAVDNGTYTNFVRYSAGYGLAQWTYWSLKQDMLEYVKGRNKSIGDLETQVEFLYKELSEDFKKVMSTLKSTTSVREASDSVLLNFERPADQSVTAQLRRASYGQQVFDKYAKEKTEEKEMPVDVKKDNTPAAWAKDAVEWAGENKLLFGDENGNYKLGDACTRQEMLVFLDRMYKLVQKQLR